METTEAIEPKQHYARLYGVDEENRSADFIISDGSPDRHSTAVNMENWILDHYKANPIVGYQHHEIGAGMCNKAEMDDIIAKSEVFFDTVEGRKVLIGRAFFEPKEINEDAEKAFQKVKFGSLKAASVDFLPFPDSQGRLGEYGYLNERGERVNEDIFYFNGQELAGWAIVNIPSNRNATKRSFRNQTANALYFIKEQLGNDYSYADIEKMQVKQILDFLERGVKPEIEQMQENNGGESEESGEENEGEGANEQSEENQAEWQRKHKLLNLKLKTQ